jgi:nucleoside phosphorylase
LEISEKSYEELKDLIPRLNLLVVTANDIETFHVRQALFPLPEFDEVIKVPHKNHTYFVGAFGEYSCIHVQCENMGSINAGGAILTVAGAIDEWQPKAVLMVGVAMGADETEQRIGDVLVAETIISYENQKYGKKKVQQRGPIVNCGNVLANRFKNVTGWNCQVEDGTKAKVLPGVILSGEKLIDNLKIRNQILAVFPQAIGAEMEGAGVYAACKSRNLTEWILVKGICDYGDGNKGVDKVKRQNLAAQCATSLSLKVFGSKIAFNDIGLAPVGVKPVQAKLDEEIIEKEAEIVAIIEQSPNNKDIMHTPIQTTVAAFLELSSYQKAVVINDVGVSLSSLTSLSAHEMDKEFFRQVKEGNLLKPLWGAIHKIKPFETNINPFS